MFWKNFSDNLTKPMREPVSTGELILWTLLIGIVAFALLDTLRAIKTFASA
jgi:hypothetical protein